MAITPETWKLINGEELIDVEWKESVPSDLDEAVVSFANERGGVILIGVEEYQDQFGRQRGRLVKGKGIRLDEGTEQKIKNIIESCEEKLEYEVTKEEETPGYGVFVIAIHEGKNKPYCTAGGTYKIRLGGRKRPILPAQMRDEVTKNIKTSIKLYLDTQKGLVTYSEYKVTWEIKDPNEAEIIKSRFPLSYKVKRLQPGTWPAFAPIDHLKLDYAIEPGINFVIRNEGKRRVEDIKILIRFPPGCVAVGERIHAIALEPKGPEVSYRLKSIHPGSEEAMPSFSPEFTKEDGEYEIYYQIMWGDNVEKGSLKILTQNYFVINE